MAGVLFLTGVYLIKNQISGKVYIGQSVNVEDRLWHHKSALKHGRHENSYLQNAWNKYGADAFLFEILCECLESELDEKEIYYINLFDSTNRERGYNLDNGGKRQKTISEETRQKMSLAKKGKYLGKNNPMYGVHCMHTNEWKQKMSERFSGKGNPMYGVHLEISEERKRQQSEIMKGSRNPFYGCKHSEETKRKMRENNKTKKAVLCIETETVFPSASEAYRQTGVYQDSITKCCRGTQCSAGGYHWKYVA